MLTSMNRSSVRFLFKGARGRGAVKTNRRAVKTAQSSDERETDERDAVRATTDASDALAYS